MNILFVCTGNTCRSCMAEAIFNELIDTSNIKANSAGIFVVPGSSASKNSVEVLKDKLTININGRSARQLNQKIIDGSDLILTMSDRITDFLSDNFTNTAAKVFSLKKYLGEVGDISDPFGGNMNVYSKTYDELYDLISILVVKLKEGSSIQKY